MGQGDLVTDALFTSLGVLVATFLLLWAVSYAGSGFSRGFHGRDKVEVTIAYVFASALVTVAVLVLEVAL